jgi:thiol-disulfide isomerase/thioredoxin
MGGRRRSIPEPLKEESPMRPTGDEPNMSEPVHGTPSSGSAPEESWFRFGDEPGTDGSAGAGPVSSEPLSSEPARVAGAVPVPGAGPAPQSASVERHEPFVVSNTPGGVNPALMTAAETISFSVGRSSSGGGLVMALVVVMLLGIGGLAFWQGPRIAAAFGGGDSGWHEDLQSALAEADATGRPVLMHFTADWCPPCKAMKKHVFSESTVQERITRDFVPVRIDLSDRGGPNSLLAMELGITGIPAVRVYSSEGHEVGGFGFVGSAAQFNAELDRLTRR